MAVFWVFLQSLLSSRKKHVFVGCAYVLPEVFDYLYLPCASPFSCMQGWPIILQNQAFGHVKNMGRMSRQYQRKQTLCDYSVKIGVPHVIIIARFFFVTTFIIFVIFASYPLPNPTPSLTKFQKMMLRGSFFFSNEICHQENAHFGNSILKRRSRLHGIKTLMMLTFFSLVLDIWL